MSRGRRPAERLDNGIDRLHPDRPARPFRPPLRGDLLSPGPLVGPVLAAQMGYLPGTIRIIVGAIFAGAVQDMVTLFFSMRLPLTPDDLAVMDPQMFNENPDRRNWEVPVPWIST